MLLPTQGTPGEMTVSEDYVLQVSNVRKNSSIAFLFNFYLSPLNIFLECFAFTFSDDKSFFSFYFLFP